MSNLQKMIRFVPEYVWFRVSMMLMQRNTFHPVSILWRWRHPYSWWD